MNNKKKEQYRVAAQKMWDSDPDTRHEFIEFENYFGYVMSRINPNGKLRDRHSCKVRVDPGSENLIPISDKRAMTYDEEQMRAKAQREWDSDSQLRKEFIQFEDFFCYERLRAENRLRVAGSGHTGGR